MVTVMTNTWKKGYGCLNDAFIMRACNNFSYIVMESKSAKFAKRLCGRSENRAGNSKITTIKLKVKWGFIINYA